MIVFKAGWLDPKLGDGFYDRSARFRTVILAIGQWVVAR